MCFKCSAFSCTKCLVKGRTFDTFDQRIACQNHKRMLYCTCCRVPFCTFPCKEHTTLEFRFRCPECEIACLEELSRCPRDIVNIIMVFLVDLEKCCAMCFGVHRGLELVTSPCKRCETSDIFRGVIVAWTMSLIETLGRNEW
eukprot:TRINITY_DN7390_c0_g1_i1.p1 TRINITY_DN7390_c0_g1~~TRINITY_DN7390_c0_g1_i1.p1  ORF type:complete len:142 (-),score=13.15 TRINITY_DN7390_c0_g1_i1:64-489(-)